MKNSTILLTLRSIKRSKKRWVALFLIVMLSVGFYSGLKVCRDAMWKAEENYLNKQNFYDYRLYSSLGFTDEEILTLKKGLYNDSIESIEGMKELDAAFSFEDEKGTRRSGIFLLMSMPEKINLPSLVSGRMPKNDRECLVDKRSIAGKSIGKKITFSNGDDRGDLSGLKNQTFTIVGSVDSPLFLNKDRGSTTLLSGERNGFAYIPASNFKSKRYTEADITLKNTRGLPVYSDEYKEKIDDKKDKIKLLLSSAADKDYKMLQSVMGSNQIKPSTHVLTRAENTGYISFRNDTSIIDGIANVFPLFFILIALLVCMTTMTRMVEEERIQIGTLKALGLSNFSITMKYMLYSGSAALLGWAIGFFAGSFGLPKIFWQAYGSLYDFSPIPYVLRASLAISTLSVTLMATFISSWISCRSELLSSPSVLIRPKTAKSGQRIMLEKIGTIWKKLPFIRKVTLRNMFRYKTRMILMLIGVGSCTALVLTGFGVRDSMINVGDLQFEGIQKYQLCVTGKNVSDLASELLKEDEIRDVRTCISRQVDASNETGRIDHITLFSFPDGTNISPFWNLRSDSKADLSLPEKKNEAVISKRLADKLGLKKGSAIKIEESSDGNANKEKTLICSGIFTNYINNYIFVDQNTAKSLFGGDLDDLSNTVLVKTYDRPSESLLKKINKMDNVTGLSSLYDRKNDVDDSVSCLNYIIWLLVLFSGTLSFIVIFNLTNINLAERSREIATVEVLGFYPEETRSYVLWENYVISLLAAVIIGLPGGFFFTRFVLGRILLDNMTFPFIIHGISYVLAFICTIFFTSIVNLFMRKSIADIKMAESLKAVE